LHVILKSVVQGKRDNKSLANKRQQMNRPSRRSLWSD